MRGPTQRSRTIRSEDSPIVVFGFPGLGDLVRCHSLIQLIAAQNPGRPIDLVARRSVVELGEFMPEVRDAIADDFQHNRLSLVARLKLAKDLRERGYGTAYVVPSSFKAALVPFFAGIPQRIGWCEELRLPLLTHARYRMRRLERIVDRICCLGSEEGHDAPEVWPEPRLRVPEAHSAEFERLAQKAKAAAPVVAIAPGSSDDNKNWPVENYAAIARRCVDAGCTVWTVGAIAHRRLAAVIGDNAPVRDHLTDSLTTLTLNIAAADIFVGNDSGPLHIAAAFEKPSVGVFGHTEPSSNAPINNVVKVAVPEFAIARYPTSEIKWPSLEPVIRRLDRAIEAARRNYNCGSSAAGSASGK
jgi:heptosyltransferase-2